MLTRELIAQAVARGWCSKANELKEMDVDLADSITAEVWCEVAAEQMEYGPESNGDRDAKI
jgi:hypothetical protein